MNKLKTQHPILVKDVDSYIFQFVSGVSSYYLCPYPNRFTTEDVFNKVKYSQNKKEKELALILNYQLSNKEKEDMAFIKLKEWADKEGGEPLYHVALYYLSHFDRLLAECAPNEEPNASIGKNLFYYRQKAVEANFIDALSWGLITTTKEMLEGARKGDSRAIRQLMYSYEEGRIFFRIDLKLPNMSYADFIWSINAYDDAYRDFCLAGYYFKGIHSFPKDVKKASELVYEASKDLDYAWTIVDFSYLFIDIIYDNAKQLKANLPSLKPIRDYLLKCAECSEDFLMIGKALVAIGYFKEAWELADKIKRRNEDDANQIYIFTALSSGYNYEKVFQIATPLQSAELALRYGLPQNKEVVCPFTNLSEVMNYLAQHGDDGLAILVSYYVKKYDDLSMKLALQYLLKMNNINNACSNNLDGDDFQNIGYAFYEGRLCQKNDEKAIEIWETAGWSYEHGGCMNNAGILRENAGNLKEAFDDYSLAHKYWDAAGTYNLGRFYLDGIYVEKDEKKAKTYMLQSAKMNYQMAIDLCKMRGFSNE